MHCGAGHWRPGLLRMIEQVVENAHRAGIRVGICGELELIRDFLAMEVDEMSVSPAKILPIRRIVRETDVSEYKMVWEKAGKMTGTNECF